MMNMTSVTSSSVHCVHLHHLYKARVSSPPCTSLTSRCSLLRDHNKKNNSKWECKAGLLPVDPWAPGAVDSESIASQLFAVSLFPYLGFLYFITKSNTAPKLTLFGFYFLLAFVAATIPAGIYAKVRYGTSLSNVDWLHGGAESLLTLTNLFIVLGLRQALRNSNNNGTAKQQLNNNKDKTSL